MKTALKIVLIAISAVIFTSAHATMESRQANVDLAASSVDYDQQIEALEYLILELESQIKQKKFETADIALEVPSEILFSFVGFPAGASILKFSYQLQRQGFIQKIVGATKVVSLVVFAGTTYYTAGLIESGVVLYLKANEIETFQAVLDERLAQLEMLKSSEGL